MKVKRFYAWILLGLIFFILRTPIAKASAWAISSSHWLEKDEKVYETFVQSIGDSGHGNVDKFIRDPKANPLYTEEDKNLRLSPDCADFPYVVRAYVAYKLRLPFSFVSETSGRGRDPRYGSNISPTKTLDQDDFPSFQKLINAVKLIHSGYYRMAPETELSDTFPVKIQRESILPGTIYYDPNGHVALVYEVTSAGRIRLVDSHPDLTLSRPWFGPKFALGSRSQGGGFRRWRPIWASDEKKIKRMSNSNLVDFSGSEQYLPSYEFNGIRSLSYYEYIRLKLSHSGGIINPVDEFKLMISDIYEDLKYRGIAVNNCVMKGISRKPHPGSLPWNIYGTDGIWEEFSTPSRDARLKVAFKDMYERTVKMISMAENQDPHIQFKGTPNQLVSQLQNVYDQLSPVYTISYTNSAGNNIFLSFDDILNRLFDLSFDPYHSIEYRWGASGREFLTSTDDLVKRNLYQKERCLRNQSDRLYNVPTPLQSGVEIPPMVNIRKWLKSYRNGDGIKTAKSFSSPTSTPIDPVVIAIQPKNISAIHTSSVNSQNEFLIANATFTTSLITPSSFSARSGNPSFETTGAALWLMAKGILTKANKAAEELMIRNARSLKPPEENLQDICCRVQIVPEELFRSGKIPDPL